MKSRVAAPYRRTKFNKKKFLQNLIIKGIIVLSVILISFILKKVNLKPTNALLTTIKKNIEYEFSIIEDSKKIYSKFTDAIDKSIEAVSVFSPKDMKKYPSPISGTVYNEFGKSIMVKDEKVINNGIDIRSLSGEDPKAFTDGVVRKVEIRENKGYFITIEKEDFQFVYGYLSRPYVEEGSIIKEGQLIGALGTNKDGNKYLRLEIWIEGTPVDPLDFIDI